jgi:hypothetical protein
MLTIGAGEKSGSACDSSERLRSTSSISTPAAAAAATDAGTLVQLATCPHNSEPADAPAISAIW